MLTELMVHCSGIYQDTSAKKFSWHTSLLLLTTPLAPFQPTHCSLKTIQAISNKFIHGIGLTFNTSQTKFEKNNLSIF